MSGKVQALPGLRCHHYIERRCLYEERLNPGLHREWRCQVLCAWEEAYERFIDQAEHFRLSGEEVGELWKKRLAAMVAESPQGYCRVYQEDAAILTRRDSLLRAFGARGVGNLDPEAPFACPLYWQELCLQALPPC